ncbi:AAC_collapsed_G0055460.mRNA.1.CDS.1 [Saccharomyces cerevisiae]|nr:AAC_collapsed_G0055460.mRNA.1.CDS.1 [Saccharomyces cerevisiae]
MSQGTLYANFKIRTWVPRGLVKALKLDVKVVTPDAAAEQFARDFPLKKVPAFVGPKGYKLTEAMAINYYLVKLSQDDKMKTQLLGADDDLNAQAQIIRWQSLANSDLCIQIANTIVPLKGGAPYNKKSVDSAMDAVDKIVDIFENRLKNYTYLATENISLADLVAASIFTRYFESLFGTEWRAQHPAIVRWFNTVRASPFLKDEYKDFKFADKPLSPPQKKKEKKAPAAAPAASKKKEEAKPAATETETSSKKPKHPLELLGKSTFVLDDWKRKYSNEDTRPVALPWFWEHYNPEEYSLWKVTYKYNDELTLTFMSNNLVGGFFNRLSASTKYMFGCLVVYGENNNNGIVGAVMVRGQDYVPAFDVAPDWESYDYAKLDPTNDDDKEFINNMWAWDKPVSVNGEPKEIVDGKVLK